MHGCLRGCWSCRGESLVVPEFLTCNVSMFYSQDELLAELEELEQEELNNKMANVRLPSVPATPLPSKPGKLSAALSCLLIHNIAISRGKKGPRGSIVQC